MLRVPTSRSQNVVAIVLIAIFVISAALSVRNQSSTWDDPYHVTGGVAQWQTGDPRLNADHPPLARLVGGAPALLIHVPKVAEAAPAAWANANIIDSTNAYFLTVEERLLWPSRICMLVFSTLLGWLLYRWCAELHGARFAWFPLSLFAFCPALLANAPLVGTDLASTALIFASVYAWWRYLQAPRWTTLAAVSLSVAAAFSTKYSALLLVPLFIVLGSVAVVANVLNGSLARRVRVVAAGLAAISVVTLFGVNLVYLFDGSFLTPAQYVVTAQAHPGWDGQLLIAATSVERVWPSWLPVPLPFYYVCGLLAQMHHLQSGHASYFLGEAGAGVWQNYFVVELLVKLSIPTLLLVILGAGRAFARMRNEWWNLLFLFLPPLLLIWVASVGNLHIGIRHVLPALPFLFLIATYAVRYSTTAMQWVGIALLLVCNEAASLRVYPDYLMYFNFIGGGADQGWRISVVGDDQGQGDAELLRWLKAHGVGALEYGGYGWGNRILNNGGIVTKPLPCADDGGLVATHVGSLLTVQGLEETRCYDWMRLREPDLKIGHNIFIYNAKSAAPAAAASP